MKWYEIDFNWDPLVGGAEDDMNANTPVPPGTATVITQLCAGALFGSITCPGSTGTNSVFNSNIRHLNSNCLGPPPRRPPA